MSSQRLSPPELWELSADARDTRRETSFNFNGENLASRDFQTLRIDELAFAPKQSVPRHSHEMACISVLLRGSCAEQLSKRNSNCIAGTTIFHPADEEHAYEFGSQTSTMLAISLNPAWVQRLRDGGLRVETPVEQNNPLLCYLGRRLAREVRIRDSASLLSIEGLVMELLGELVLKGAGSRPAPLERAVMMLRDRFRESISLSSVADEVGVHPVQLARDFRHHFGMTVGEFIRRLRVEYAIDRLSSGSASIAHVAHAAGFYDHSHFCRTFKAQTGTSPKQFMAAVRGE